MELSRLLGILLGLLLPCASSYRDRIIGGSECPEKAHPWLVQLYHLTTFVCAGVLIDPEWVVTAAHCCISSGNYIIRLGEHDVDAPSGHEQMRTSTNTILYDSSSYCETECENDIMLIRLNAAANITKYVAPIDLATTCGPLGTSCTVMGWGAITSPEETFPSVPHCVNITILSPQLCKDEFPCVVLDNICCAGDLAGGKDSCRGDSGGPLVCNNELQGIVSLGGNPCGQSDLPAVYTKIARYASWIQDNIGGNSEARNAGKGRLE